LVSRSEGRERELEREKEDERKYVLSRQQTRTFFFCCNLTTPRSAIGGGPEEEEQDYWLFAVKIPIFLAGRVMSFTWPVATWVGELRNMREKSEWKDQIKRSREIIIERLISSTKEEEETERLASLRVSRVW
jgi:hypothetical protein